MSLVEEKTDEALEREELLAHLFPLRNLRQELDEYLDDLHEQYPGNRRLNVILVNGKGWRVYVKLLKDEPWLALYLLGKRPCDPKYFDAVRYCPQCNKVHARPEAAQSNTPTTGKRRSLADWKQWWLENNPYIKDFKPVEPGRVTPSFPSMSEDDVE